jgi:hypothetical protein
MPLLHIQLRTDEDDVIDPVFEVNLGHEFFPQSVTLKQVCVTTTDKVARLKDQTLAFGAANVL